MTHKNKEIQTFRELGIDNEILSILDRNQFVTPTPIQHQVIPVALLGKDVVGIAQTGTGKTLAFGIPMLQRLMSLGGQGLILLPTRELALQVDEVLQKIGRPLNLKTAVLIGGASMQQQIRSLRHGAHIVVATPGRLLDQIEQKNFSLQNIKIAVLDEADRMFDFGFAPSIKRIMAMIPHNRQTLMFSATMAKEVSEMAARFMQTPYRIEVAPAGTTATKVEQEVFITNRDLKMQLLDKLLTDNKGVILVFARTRRGVKKVAVNVRAMGHTVAELHSDRSLSQRREALEGFKSGRFRILVATDIAARGIDVSDIELVINYDLPTSTEDYVHRIGRTGRAGSLGKAVSFAAPEERKEIRQIEKLIRKTLPISALPVLPPRRELPKHIPKEFNFTHRPKRHQAPDRPWRRRRNFRNS
jgi:ATP-dependent RNA helicase RhlE